MADLLADQGHLAELQLADNGDLNAATRLAGLLADHGRIDEATMILQAWIANGDRNAR